MILGSELLQGKGQRLQWGGIGLLGVTISSVMGTVRLLGEGVCISLPVGLVRGRNADMS